MKHRRLALLVLAAVVGAVVYATAAPAGQQASPSRAEFNALKTRLAKNEKVTNAVATLVVGCLQHGVPISRYDGYVALDQNGNGFATTALDITDEAGATPQTYLLDVGSACASALQKQFGVKLKVTHLSAAKALAH